MENGADQSGREGAKKADVYRRGGGQKIVCLDYFFPPSTEVANCLLGIARLVLGFALGPGDIVNRDRAASPTGPAARAGTSLAKRTQQFSTSTPQ